MSLADLRQFGFEGGIRIRDLQDAVRLGAADFPVPRIRGVYLVVRQDRSAVRFLRTSRAGAFKRRNPTRPIAALRDQWVPDATIVYIGKAGGTGRRATLHSRLLSYMRFGLGHPAGHWGGRCIWQLSDVGALRVYWKPMPTGEPRDLEKRLLAVFFRCYGCLPFANLTR